MFSRDAITAAVACSCLFLMVARQSVNACSCYEDIDQTESCLAKEIWVITVKTEENHKGRGDLGGYYLYDISFDDVMGSAMQFQIGDEAFFKISHHSSCIFNFTTNATYLIAAERTDQHYAPVQICQRDENGSIICQRIRILVKMQKTETE